MKKTLLQMSNQFNLNRWDALYLFGAIFVFCLFIFSPAGELLANSAIDTTEANEAIQSAGSSIWDIIKGAIMIIIPIVSAYGLVKNLVSGLIALSDGDGRAWIKFLYSGIFLVGGVVIILLVNAVLSSTSGSTINSITP